MARSVFNQTDGQGVASTFGIYELALLLQNEAWWFCLAIVIFLLASSGVVHRLLGIPPKGAVGKARTMAQSTKRPVPEGSLGKARGPKPEAFRVNVMKQTKLIRDFGKDGNLAEAVAAFESLKREFSANNVPIYSMTYSSIIDSCVHCKDMVMALNLFAEARTLQRADVASYNAILKGHLASGDIELARGIFAEMGQQGLPANLVTFHGILHACTQTGDWQSAWRYVEQMRDTAANKPNSVTCSILLKFVTGPRQQAYMQQILPLINEIETALDEILLSSLVEAFIKIQRLDMLEERLAEFRKQGLLQHLTVPTYGAMIKAYGQARNLHQVRKLWREMTASSVQPTMIVLGCVVDALVMNGAVDEAWQLVSEVWEDERLKDLINTIIYSTILKGFAISRRMEKVIELYDEMQARGIACNVVTFNTLLNALARCGELHRVPKILEDMKASTPPVDPDMITHSTLMKAYCASGDLDMALNLLRDVETSTQFDPDEVMYNSLLDGCAKQNRVEDAFNLLAKMKAASVAPSNYTVSIMIKLLGRQRRLNQAFAMVDSLIKEQGVRPNIQVFTCLMQACFNNKQLSKALAVHDQCVESGCLLDEKAYVALASGCLSAKAPEKAAEVVRCAFALKGHCLQQGKGAPGVDARCLQEVLNKLRASDKELIAQKLSYDIETRKSSRGSGTTPATQWRPGLVVSKAASQITKGTACDSNPSCSWALDSGHGCGLAC